MSDSSSPPSLDAMRDLLDVIDKALPHSTTRDDMAAAYRAMFELRGIVRDLATRLPGYVRDAERLDEMEAWIRRPKAGVELDCDADGDISVAVTDYSGASQHKCGVRKTLREAIDAASASPVPLAAPRTEEGSNA